MWNDDSRVDSGDQGWGQQRGKCKARRGIFVKSLKIAVTVIDRFRVPSGQRVQMLSYYCSHRMDASASFHHGTGS